jgi:pimeloyl-ACP methyl ester carboxylesterase
LATYVLVHGSSQGGWIWQKVAAGLRAAGHVVYHPSLDGCGERQGSLRPGITLDTHGTEIARLLFYEDLKDVILVGTSSGGMVIQRAAEQVPDRVGRLVYIDALAPMPGESTSIINSSEPPPETQLAQPLSDRSRNLIRAEYDPELAEWAIPRFTAQPRAALHDPVDLKEFWSRSWKVVLRCTRSFAPSEAHQRRTAEHFGGSYAEIDAGHFPMLSHSAEITRYLIERDRA